MNPIEVILREHPVIVVDGALATELERRGADLNDPLWSARVLLEQPDLIRAVHLDYFRAGADCAITASYQATIEGFARRGLSESEAIQLMQKSVQLAREARDQFWADEKNRIRRPRPFIAASVGPYGAFLADGSEYRGDYGLSEADLIAFHRPRLRALIASGADLLACETIPCMIEARALVKLLAEFPETSAWFTFSAKDDEHICGGEKFSECVAWLDAYLQVAAVGINCTSPKYITSLVREARKATSKPVVVYPNSGEVYNPAANTWHGETSSDAFGAQAKEWYRNGASLIGGCCRTTPEHIREIAAWARA